MSEDIAQHAKALLSLGQIERVVSIDDAYSEGMDVEEALATVGMVEQSVREALATLFGLETSDVDVVKQALRRQWSDIGKLRKDEVIGLLTPAEVGGESQQSLVNDLQIATHLQEIFGAQLETLPYKTWQARRAEFIFAEMPATLVLVDLDLSGEGSATDEGLRVISELLASQPEAKIYCALLTNRFHLVSVHEDWKMVCEQSGLSPDRFVLIPKDSLNEDERKFLALLKLVVMNRSARELTAAVHKAFAEFLEAASTRVTDIDIYEFEQIICVSSLKEGVWEADTLVRIFSLFHKKLVRRNLRLNTDLHLLTDRLRAFSNVIHVDWGPNTPSAITIQRLEWYEDAEEVNEQLLPIELGDLFAIDSKPDKRFILVAQPCDLMMRMDGRHYTVENAMLLEAKAAASGEDESFGFTLHFYQPTVNWRVDLRKANYVCLDVLDFCALRSDGRAVFQLGTKISERLGESWRARAAALAKQVQKTIKRHEALVAKGLKKAEADVIATSAGPSKLLKGVIDSSNRTVTYNIRRVGRLKQPRAGALLSRYANSMARDAFEHDLVRREKATASSPSSGEASAAAGVLPQAAVDATSSKVPHIEHT